jgi:hypothetical protein
VANETPITFPVTYTAADSISEDGWNLVGNPFPSTIDWSSETGWIKQNLEQTSYIRNNGLTSPNFAVWNGLIGINGGSRYIAAGQAFWIKASGEGVPMLTATEAVKSSGTQTSFFRIGGSTITDLLRVTMVKGSVKDEIAIHFVDGATEGFDSNADAWKLAGSAFNISSLLANGSKLAINSLPALNCQATVKLSVDNAANGAYQLAFADLETFAPNVTIELSDKFLGTKVDVRNGSYSFNVTSAAGSKGAGRFELLFSIAGPSSTFDLVSTTAICEGANAMVSINNSQVNAMYTVSLNDEITGNPIVGNGNSIDLTIQHSILKAGDNIISIEASVGNCNTVVSKEITIKVASLGIVTTENKTICVEGSATLIANGAGENSTYRWYESETTALAIPGQTISTFATPNLTSSTTYYVSIVNSLGCEGNRVAVSANVVPSINVVVTATDGVLTSNYNDGNQWYFNNEILPGATTFSLEPKNSGVYRVEVSMGGCNGSADYEYVVTGLGEENVNELVSVSPNPTTERIKVTIKHTEKGVVTLMNGQGQVIKSESLVTENGDGVCEFNMSEFSKGVYIIRFMDNVQLKDVKVVKK